MSIRRMTLGAGYRYLMSSVARGDAARGASGLTAYYSATGTPPGSFLGSGLAGLDGGRGIPGGAQVTEEHLWRMLGMLQDPVTGAQLGRSPAGGHTAYVDRDGQGRSRRPVAGFDLTFSAPKSVSTAWALADPATRELIHAAHRRALQLVIEYAEVRVFASRSGKGGRVQEDVRGVVATAFDHWDSRAGDPQLHTHVVVMNRVQTVDGVWRTIDSKALFRWTVALSELYQGVLSDCLTETLGWGWEPRERAHSPVPKWEVAGVPQALMDEFSQRASVIERAKDAMVAEFVAAHGRQPTAREVIQMRQQATLQTRPEKQLKPLAEMVQGWRARADRFVGPQQSEWVAELAVRVPVQPLGSDMVADEMLAEVGRLALGVVAGHRATFTRPNVYAEALRQLHGVRFAGPSERIAVAERVTDLALGQALRLTPPDLEVLPARLRRPDGTSRLRPRDSEVYSTVEILDAETRLVDAARATDGAAIDQRMARDVCAVPLDNSGRVLSAEQAAAVVHVVTSGRPLDVLVGPAGSGKSTAMAGVRSAWEAQYGVGSVVGLAPSAAAAEVLAEAVGIPTENTAKWLTEQQRQPERAAALEALSARLLRASPNLTTRRLLEQARSVAAEIDRWQLRAGQLVIIDEASMAATDDLDTITTHAQKAGAKVLLVGDWAQLSPVAAGGAFHLLAHDRDDVATLHEVRRFAHAWERNATLRLRTGDPAVVDEYLAHHRVQGGDRESMLDLLYDAWRQDVDTGLTALMIAADTETVHDLNRRAQADRIREGEVATPRALLTDGTAAGVGDLIVTRRNDRRLVAPGGFVKNGDRWRVLAHHRDGGLIVQRPRGGRLVRLPAGYVAAHVELGYATTAQRAQGRTVDRAHAYLGPAATRETLYVMASRGVQENVLYVDTSPDPDPASRPDDQPETEPRDVLLEVLARDGVDRAASTVLAQEWGGRVGGETGAVAREPLALQVPQPFEPCRGQTPWPEPPSLGLTTTHQDHEL